MLVALAMIGMFLGFVFSPGLIDVASVIVVAGCLISLDGDSDVPSGGASERKSGILPPEPAVLTGFSIESAARLVRMGCLMAAAVPARFPS